MAEFYSREKHEKVLGDLATNQELQSIEDASREEKLYLAKEKLRLEEEHGRLLARAWMVARNEDLLRKTREMNADTSEKQDAAFRQAKQKYVAWIESSEDRLSHYSGDEKVFRSELPSIAEIGLTEMLDEDDKPTITCRLVFPVTASPNHDSYDEREVSLRISPEGDIENWKNVPEPLKSSIEGKASVLEEILRCFAELGMNNVPILLLDEALMIPGEGETLEKTGRGDRERNVRFEASERFRILMNRGPLFRCEQKVASRNSRYAESYTAFVYRDFIVFDSLYYGHAIFFLHLPTSLNAGSFAEFHTKTRSEQQEFLRTLLPASFFEEIEQKKDERKRRGNRFPLSHLNRPDVADEDEEYHEHLERYYEKLFQYIAEHAPNPDIRNDARDGRQENVQHQN